LSDLRQVQFYWALPRLLSSFLLERIEALVAQATGFRNAECGMRNAEETRIELIPNTAFRIPHFFRCLRFSSSYDLGVTQ